MSKPTAFLHDQIITYIGNKRLILPYIEEEIIKIQSECNTNKTINADLFSGTGVVARLLKKYSKKLIVNDLEKYSCIVNECYLTNKSDFNETEYNYYYNKITRILNNKKYYEGIITKNYAPKDELNIKENERVFYTRENALIIDTIRNQISKIKNEELHKYFLAPLLYKASVHTNTAGIFKGFYKDKDSGIGKYGGSNENALQRIRKNIDLIKPIFSEYETQVEISNRDALEAAKIYKDLDIVYLDPPYNQHPYGSNYFMLNVILNNEIPKNISKVSGIPDDWNRSNYNRRNLIHDELEKLVSILDTKYIILSYNSEGFLSYKDIKNILEKYGKLNIREIDYNAYRGSRNLNKRDRYVKEYLFILKKI